MMRLGKWSGRKWVVVGVVVGVVSVLGMASYTWSRCNSWPARAVISLPGDCWPQGFTLDGRSYQTSGPSGVLTWDVATGRPQGTPSRMVIWRRSPASDRQSFVGVTEDAFAESELVWIDADSRTIKARFPVKSREILEPRLVDEGRSIRAILLDRTQVKEVATWDLASGAESRRPILGPGNLGFARTTPVAYSPDGRLWAYADLNRNGIQLWDAEADRPSGNLLRSPTTRLAPWSGAAFSPDGKTLIVSQQDGRAEFWDLADSRPMRTIQVHPKGFISNDIQFSPDGRTMASTGLDSGSTSWVAQVLARLRNLLPGWSDRPGQEVVILDLATGQTLARSPGSIHPQFSPDGRTIVTHEWDETFSVRDAPQPIHPHQ